MSEREYINKNCVKCENKNTDKCEIIKNINGEYQCVYFIEKGNIDR